MNAVPSSTKAGSSNWDREWCFCSPNHSVIFADIDVSDEWWEYQNYCQRGYEFRLDGVEDVIAEEGLIEEWRKERTGEEDLIKKLDEFLLGKGKLPEAAVALSDGCCICSLSCENARMHRLREAQSGLLKVDGTLDMSAERVSRLHSALTDEDVCGPLAGEAEIEAWAEYCESLIDHK